MNDRRQPRPHPEMSPDPDAERADPGIFWIGEGRYARSVDLRTDLFCSNPALRDQWFVVADAGDVVDAPTAVTLLGDRFVVWRVADGSVRAAADRCPHREAPLSGGGVTDGCLVCPYHAWAFDADGACVDVPSSGAGAPIPSAANLSLLAVRERYGLIWLCAGTPAGEPPEIAQDRVKQYYEMKGYPKDWIDKRLRGIAIRQDLTEEWKNRSIEEDLEFAILTNEITKATFGKTVKEYRDFKSLGKPNQNIRDHMTDWELILTMVGEKATTDITITKDSEGLEECRESAAEGGTIAGNTRKEIEEKTGKSLVSDENYLQLDKKSKRLVKD